MKKLFWGFLLIYLNFNLTLNGHAVEILPDFAGYILLVKGIDELKESSRLFSGARPFAIVMAVYTAVLWVGKLLNVSAGGWIGEMLSLAAGVMALYISWLLIQGVLEMEKNEGRNWQGNILYSRWKLLLILQIVFRLWSWMANLANISILFSLAVPLVICNLLVIILYLLAWWRTVTAWELRDEEVPEQEVPEEETE